MTRDRVTALAFAPLAFALIAGVMFIAPAAGYTSELMLQDTLKSMIVSVFTLVAAIVFFWNQRESEAPLAWHAVMGLPLLLMAYALGSMAWSHEYLAAVEAIRWFIFALLSWLGLNLLTRERLPALAACIHAGAVAASTWAVLQFCFDFAFFPQGPPPSSTFINRNFFAEFAVATLPFGAVLLARSRRTASIAALAFTNGMVIAAILMTGTRSALLALWLQLLVILPFALWRIRGAFGAWSVLNRGVAALVLLATVVGLGSITAGNEDIVREGRGTTGIDRGLKRTASVSPADPSLGLRLVMWRATLDMIAARPLSGVGAGAWENEIPLFQAKGTQLETDYYVHNEYLQLIAEYGVVGWAFILGLMVFLLEAIRRTYLQAIDAQEAAWRTVFLASLAAFLLVSSIGFPWRMATTGALFALCLAGLAASDLRLGERGLWSGATLRWSRRASLTALFCSSAALILAIHISRLAAIAESDLVAATRIAYEISHSPDANDPRWDATKREMLELTARGIAINPHYRKITPIVADELARWGDWQDATPIWESVLASRPNIIAIIANVARGHAVLGDYAKARIWLERAQKIQPDAQAIRSLEVIILSRTGEEPRALALARRALSQGTYDFDMANTGFSLALRAGDYALAEKAMKARIEGWPSTKASGLVQLGTMYAAAVRDPKKALDYFNAAKNAASPAEWQSFAPRIPLEFHKQLGLPQTETQTSASKG